MVLCGWGLHEPKIMYCSMSTSINFNEVHRNQDCVLFRGYVYEFGWGSHEPKISYDDTRVHMLLLFGQSWVRDFGQKLSSLMTHWWRSQCCVRLIETVSSALNSLSMIVAFRSMQFAWLQSEVTSDYRRRGGVGTTCSDKQMLCLATYVMGAPRIEFRLGMNHSVPEEIDGWVC